MGSAVPSSFSSFFPLEVKFVFNMYVSSLSPRSAHSSDSCTPMETKQTGHKRGASESLNGGDPPSETEQRATRSAIRSRRNSAELHASGTVQERRGRDVAEHHTYFDLGRLFIGKQPGRGVDF